MRWGAPDSGGPGATVHDIKDCEEMLKVYVSQGHNEIDNAHIYNGGTAEEYLGQIDYKSLGIVVDTKLYPSARRGVPNGVTLSASDVRKYIDIQLKALKTDCIDLWYLHGPDRVVPIEETLQAVNELYKEGKFKRFGLSNFMAWEVAQAVTLCEEKGWIKPTAYQGVYNCLHRAVEPELFPCLRKFGLSFYGFNPMVGGLLTDQFTRADSEAHNAVYTGRYWKPQYFDALDLLNPLAKKHGLTQAEIALRWAVHHSAMKPEFGDHVLIGVSKVTHLEANLKDLEKGPLPEDVVKALDEGWQLVKSVASNYWH
ncbi:Aldo/keto reductase [Pseudohyphozyma bogoriensis]|nr:Aldo/keto reductase [Pseudohyphozyma bogoriensis]